MSENPGSAMDDFFGQRPLRPDHPDFWRLSQILLGTDLAVDGEPTADAKDAAWRSLFENVIDQQSALYMASQRALLAAGDSGMDPVILARFTKVITDAFLAGVVFQQLGGHTER